MSRRKIDLVSPPFHGHLHPVLGLGRILAESHDVRVLTTPDAEEQVHTAGLAFAPILGAQVKEVWGIANTDRPVRGRPWMLLRQFQDNLRLMQPLRRDMERAWRDRKPEFVIADFTLPCVGYWARLMGARWWTAHPSPLAIETADGPPSYLGGWKPRKTALGRVRDGTGRFAVRQFKRALFRWYAVQLGALGLPGIYRPDGSECVYSDDVILGLSLKELEFPATWPRALRWIGPIVYSPGGAGGAAPSLDSRRKNILVTMGTHLPYAREGYIAAVKRWARASDEFHFHYTAGRSAPVDAAGAEGSNWRLYDYINYAQHLRSFDGIVHHAGAGILHHAIEAGLPAVTWPQDYDQFDFSARLTERGLAVECRRAADVPKALRQVLGEPAFRERVSQLAPKTAPAAVSENLLRVFAESI